MADHDDEHYSVNGGDDIDRSDDDFYYYLILHHYDDAAPHVSAVNLDHPHRHDNDESDDDDRAAIDQHLHAWHDDDRLQPERAALRADRD